MVTKDRNFKRAVRERMKITGEAYTTARAALHRETEALKAYNSNPFPPPPSTSHLPRCTKEKPIQGERLNGQTVIHDFEKTYEGAWFDTMTCKNCGHEVKAAK